MVYLLIFVAIVLADQISKAYVDASLPLGASVKVIDKVFSIYNGRNTGAAFSMLANSEWSQVFFIIITVLALAGGMLYIVFAQKSGKWLNTTVTLIAAGAIGNFIDRITFAEVRDFLFIEFFANCNVADVAISVGAIMLIVYLLFMSDDALFKKKKKDENA